MCSSSFRYSLLMVSIITFLFSFFLSSHLNAEQIVLHLKGYLGKEEIARVKQTFEEQSADHPQLLIIEIDSSSGQLSEVLDLAKDIYALKAEKQTQVIVYIQQTALGPSAIIPFLADQLYLSYFVSWGDIPLEEEKTFPTNILRNNVRSLISPDNPHRAILLLMASAMTDPSLQVVDDGGWKIERGDFPIVISSPSEALVVNHNQLQELGLSSGMRSLHEFRSQFEQLQDEEKEEVQQPLEVSLKDVDREFPQWIHFDKEGPNLVGLIQINQKNSQISQATWIYVKHALDYYKEIKPRLVILELNTPGGEVFAAQKISDALKDFDTQYNIPVIAFINNWAISAGAMLAYSSRFITVTKDASMGAAEPVQLGEGGQMVTASEKVNSALRADFANRAGFFDRNPYIAEAMVDKDIILVMRHGKIIKLDSEDQIRTLGTELDQVISPKGKLLTLNASEMIEYGVADLLLLPKKTGVITEGEKQKGKWPADKMLLFHAPFFDTLPNAVVDVYQMDWKIQFLALLANPIAASLLFLGMLLGFYMEINSPGFGVPGSIALLCLFLIVLSSFALEVVDILEVILLLVGVVFIALDLFLIPTFGLLGIVGVVFCLVGLFGMMLPEIKSVDFEFDTQTFNAAGEAFIKRLSWLSGTLVVALALIALMGRYVMPTFRGFRRFVLSGHEQVAAEGYVAGEDPKLLPQPGSKGVVLATLRPAGKVIIQDRIYEAMTAGGFIEKETPIVVDRLEGSVMIVDVEKKEG
ncbi:MAG: serine protease [Waddliaceae bacterium]